MNVKDIVEKHLRDNGRGSDGYGLVLGICGEGVMNQKNQPRIVLQSMVVYSKAGNQAKPPLEFDKSGFAKIARLFHDKPDHGLGFNRKITITVTDEGMVGK